MGGWVPLDPNLFIFYCKVRRNYILVTDTPEKLYRPDSYKAINPGECNGILSKKPLKLCQLRGFGVPLTGLYYEPFLRDLNILWCVNSRISLLKDRFLNKEIEN